MPRRGVLAIAAAVARAARSSSAPARSAIAYRAATVRTSFCASFGRSLSSQARLSTTAKGDISAPPNASSPALDGTQAASSETPSSECASPGDVSYEKNEVDEALEECMNGGSVSDLSRALGIVHDRGDEFTERNVSTALHALGSLAEAHPEEKATDSDQYEALIEMMVHGLRRMSLSQLSQAVLDAAQAGFTSDKLYDEIARHVVDRLADASLESVLTMLRGLHKAGQNPSILLFEQLGKRLQEERKNLSPEELEEVTGLYKAFGYDSPF